jgi:hypothetical protein
MVENNSDSERLEREVQQSFLNEHVFAGLTNLNDGFDTKTIKYFSYKDFMIVIDKCEKLNICIYGIEPWLNGEYYDVKSNEDFGFKLCDPKWYRLAMEEFEKEGHELQYAASYNVPNELMNNNTSL